MLLFCLLLLLFSSEHTPSATANDADTLTAGQSLAAGEKLVSRNGKFALGFFQPPAGNTTTSNYTGLSNTTAPGWYLGIWFNMIPAFTPVWVANRDTPIAGPNQLNLTRLQISGDGNSLVILNHATGSVLWSTATQAQPANATAMTNTTAAVLLDSGNLALVDSSGSGSGSAAPLWQSFDHPADVFLPGAKFGRNKLTGLNREFISNKNLLDLGLGAYRIGLDSNGDGAMVLRHRAPYDVVYWSLGSSVVSLLDSILAMNPQTRGLISAAYVDNSEEQYYTYNVSDNSSLLIAVLDISGQLKMNVWSPAARSWKTLYAQPAAPCTAFATCGPFTVCDGNSDPFCGCMQNFSQKSPQDWELGDRTGGCIRDTPLDCSNSSKSSTDMFLPITRVTLPYDLDSVEDAATASKCAEACLHDCTCTAYSYNSSCFIWHGELLNVKKNDDIDNNSEDVLYLRLAAEDLQSVREGKRRSVAGVVSAATVIGVGLLVLVLLSVIIWRKQLKCFGLSQGGGGGGIVAFRYTDLGHATKNFSEMLGGGGFGSVFKGVLSDSTLIAVKRLDGARQGEKQFRAEVSSIGMIQHINLVKLIGFCSEGEKRLLVYEHMVNGSLDAHLFRSNAATVLTWSTRRQIAIGVARGLSYLHQSCCECIIHCDIKPENILLDASFVPKIADFGLAAIIGRDFSRVLTTSRGTVGYLAPEWLSGVAITPKVDVYSFGMLLLEVISGRRNSPDQMNTSNSYYAAFFPVRAVSKLHEGDVQSLVDPQLHVDFDLEEAERFCKVACWCIQDNELDRPTMGEVVRVLEGLQEVDMPPMPRLLAALTERYDASSVQ
ncbi:hypothetical protein BS78_09G018500 [Paspalum vaginatum]|nr:hypothetical protein BS78_09G018500 [Paspalum vaginatum]